MLNATYKAIRAFLSVHICLTRNKSKRFNTTALTTLLKRLYERAGIKGATSHSGRRSGITALSVKGVSVLVIAELANHKHIATTQKYIDVNDNMMKNAIEML